MLSNSVCNYHLQHTIPTIVALLIGSATDTRPEEPQKAASSKSLWPEEVAATARAVAKHWEQVAQVLVVVGAPVASMVEAYTCIFVQDESRKDPGRHLAQFRRMVSLFFDCGYRLVSLNILLLRRPSLRGCARRTHFNCERTPR